MNNYLNYLIEANIGLIIFMVAYVVMIRNETDFVVQRLFLLVAVLGSLVFPLISIATGEPNIPSLGRIMPTLFLPEITIGEQRSGGALQYLQENNPWEYVGLFYVIGLTFFLARFILQLLQLIRKTRFVKTYRVGQCSVIESADKQTFSFFNFIFLGLPDDLTSEEKEKIIHHETVHARQFHSFDILLINVVGIFFWFNPILKLYKKIFIQLHEFEADARAVENRDANVYCSLLAKVALQSAGFPLANHFNNSLTLKRIIMMKTIKHKMKKWKVIAAVSVIPIVFFFVSCQDQLTSAQYLSTATDIPAEVQSRITELRKATPEKEFVVIETTTSEGWATLGRIKEADIASIDLITPTAMAGEKPRTFAVVILNGKLDKEAIETQTTDDVYTMVDETATPVGGIPKFYEHVGRKLRYPAEARQKGIEGRVFVEFVVGLDGEVEVTGISGIGGGCELEAMRVVQSSPKWNPGKNQGVPVKQKMVLPIYFRLNDTAYEKVAQTPDGTIREVVVATVTEK